MSESVISASVVVTPAMRRRSLRSPAAEHAWVESCLSGNGYSPELLAAKIEHRMAVHAAEVAWAEVEYAAWRSCNAVPMGHRPEDPRRMDRLVSAAYEATNVATSYLGPVLILEGQGGHRGRA